MLLSRCLLGVSLLVLISCTHGFQRSDRNGQPQVESESSKAPVVAESSIPSVTERESEFYGEVPSELNPHVEKWLNYFQGRGHGHMERYLSRSNRYIKLMKEILAEHGLPEDLVYIALIESGFSSRAKSHASAVGYWQFIRGTARRYGLKMNYYVDERRDPVLSTHAAAKYLKGLYNVFGSWYLAMASYNAGENRIKGAVMRTYTRDFWELVRLKKLPRETLNYVPKFIAARLIANDPAKYGFANVAYADPIEFTEVNIKHSVSLKRLARSIGASSKKLRALNPQFRRDLAPATRGGLKLRVPVTLAKRTLAVAHKSRVNVRYVAHRGTESYRVRRGESLYSIARKFGTTIAKLRDVNNFSRRSVLRAGKKIRIPSSRKLAANLPKKSHKGTYVVRRGDTLIGIAKRFGVTLRDLRKKNKLSRRSILREGQTLLIPGLTSSTGKSAKRRRRERVHIVQRGETLSHIAQRYGIRINNLTRRNDLSKRDKIVIGRKLVIPR